MKILRNSFLLVVMFFCSNVNANSVNDAEMACDVMRGNNIKCTVNSYLKDINIVIDQNDIQKSRILCKALKNILNKDGSIIGWDLNILFEKNKLTSC